VVPGLKWSSQPVLEILANCGMLARRWFQRGIGQA
jgi:hypothetical protein